MNFLTDRFDAATDNKYNYRKFIRLGSLYTGCDCADAPIIVYIRQVRAQLFGRRRRAGLGSWHVGWEKAGTTETIPDWDYISCARAIISHRAAIPHPVSPES